jgi:hypothetical protein
MWNYARFGGSSSLETKFYNEDVRYTRGRSQRFKTERYWEWNQILLHEP